MDKLLPLEREKRLLARLGPKMGQASARHGSPGTGRGGLMPEDVAAGLSFIRRPLRGVFVPDVPKQRLVMYIWAGHNSQSDVDKVVSGLVLEASKHITWKPRPGQIAGLASLALLEHTYPTPCRTCSATGEVYEKVELFEGSVLKRMELVRCKVCHGTGRRPWGRQRLADMFGVKEWEWRRTWASRYQRMQLMIYWMEGRALAQIRRALRRA